ncbi:MAG: nucleoside monophosphate kinase [Candidatus Pacebacteria bacterium]|nr:nucleoside monophosphate kinase [Candidatus Paceibacterota bacterium]
MNRQLLILLSGHNASGKSTLAKKIVSELDINQVNGDIVRNMLIANVKFYSDIHYSYPSDRTISASKVISVFRKELVRELLFQDQSVLIDGAGITKKARTNYLKLIDNCNKEIIIIMIEAILEEDELLARLSDRDKKDKKHRWVDFYRDIRKKEYEPVENSEADLVLRYDQKNSREIIQAIKDIYNRTS